MQVTIDPRPGPAPIAGEAGGRQAEDAQAPEDGDRVFFSARARELSRNASAPEDPLNEEERARLDELKASDREVRAHEQAHRVAGGDLVTGATRFEYTVGPDGQRYAVGGEVRIDTSPETDPRATLEKAERILRAALAPAHPSPADRGVAAKAAAMAARARIDLARGSVGLDVVT